MPDEKKIIIDEDWKSQVQAEKEKAAQAQPATTAQAAATAESAEAYDPPMPPASFELLITSLATEALVALGAVPHPVTGKAQPQRNQAKYLIDTLELLRQKTAGNLSASEQEVLDSLLHQMRLVFVQTAGQAAGT